MSTPPKTPNLTRPEAVGIVLAILVGGGLFIWFETRRGDEPLSAVLLAVAVSFVLGLASALLVYRWGKRRLAEGRSLGGTPAVLSTAAFGVGVAALIRSGPVALEAAVLTFCLVLPSTIFLLVHVWPRRRDLF